MATAFNIKTPQQSPQFTGNLVDIILSRNNARATLVRMTLMFDGQPLCPPIELFYDSNGEIRIKARDIAKGLINDQLYDFTSHYEHSPLHVLTFRFTDEGSQSEDVKLQLIDGQADLHNFYLYHLLHENFLTWQPQIVTMPSWQPQWLSYVYTPYAPTCIRFMTRLYEKDGTTHEYAFYETNQEGLIRLNVSFERLWEESCDEWGWEPVAYDVYGVGVKNSGMPAQIESPKHPYAQRFILRSEQLFDQCFIYQNSLGGFDSVMATGVSTFQPSGESKVFTNNGEDIELGGTYTSHWEQNTGYIGNERLARQWREFLNSSNRYIFNREHSVWCKIVVDEFEVKDKAAALGSYKFKYRLARPDESASYHREELKPLKIPI